MGFFSKLLKDNGGDAALNALKNVARGVMDSAAKQSGAPEHAPASRCPAAASPYDDMPAEENQFSFGGTYVQYFDTVFREAFPAYQITHTGGADGRSTVFTFSNGGTTALVVELKSERSSAQKLRRQCEETGTPYLRFYYDHHGWWNTRTYVTERTRRALHI